MFFFIRYYVFSLPSESTIVIVRCVLPDNLFVVVQIE